MDNVKKLDLNYFKKWILYVINIDYISLPHEIDPMQAMILAD